MTAEADADGNPGGWQNEVYDLLRRNRVMQFAYVPDAGHKILIDLSLGPQRHAKVDDLTGRPLDSERDPLTRASSEVGHHRPRPFEEVVAPTVQRDDEVTCREAPDRCGRND